jgi:hypothetical protein
VPALFVVFAFRVLTFLASAATLALEPSSQPGGIWNVALVFLAALNAASGFVVLGGVPALDQGLWRVVMACTAAGLVSAVVTTLVARQFAAILELQVSPTAARQIVSLALAAGLVVLLIVLKLNQLPSE